MSVIDLLIDTIDDHGQDWIDVAIDVAIERANADGRYIEVASFLRRHKASIAKLGATSLVAMMAQLANRDVKGARRTFLRTKATFDELMVAADQSEALLVRAAEVDAIIRDVAISAVRMLPIIMSVV